MRREMVPDSGREAVGLSHVSYLLSSHLKKQNFHVEKTTFDPRISPAAIIADSLRDEVRRERAVQIVLTAFFFEDLKTSTIMQNHSHYMTIKNVSLIAVFFYFPVFVFCQKYDYNWMAGESGPPPAVLDNFVLDFNHYPVQVSSVETNYYMVITHHSISNEDGKFLYYSNGCSLWQYDTLPVVIADDLNNDDHLCGDPDYEAMNQSHGLFSIPLENNRFMVFGFTIIPQTGCYVKRFLYHIVDFSNGIGQMEIQDTVIASGCFNGAAANRHANGRDWWILLSDQSAHRFYRWLLTPDGLMQADTQSFSPTPPGKSYGWYEFSPDGQKLATRYSDKGTALYDFDRCTGLLSNYQLLPKAPGISSYIVFSPNNRFLYSGDDDLYKLIQYDLQAQDIAGSEQTVAIHDGFVDSITLYPTSFHAMQRGPDGKIYIFGSASYYMHVIDFPDRPGISCQVRQRAIVFPSYTFDANAYYPNYRLGPIDGSSCDTLGINNIPMAMYHYDIEDTLAPLTVTFTDVSYYEPTNWFWTFGDGSTSTEVSPVHTYAGPGTYTACLIVHNAYGADTLCREITVDDISGVQQLPVLPQVQVAPNPFTDVLYVNVPAMVNGGHPRFRLLDLFGREVAGFQLDTFHHTFQLGGLPAGLYVWQVDWNGKVTQTGRVVKIGE